VSYINLPPATPKHHPLDFTQNVFIMQVPSFRPHRYLDISTYIYRGILINENFLSIRIRNYFKIQALSTAVRGGTYSLPAEDRHVTHVARLLHYRLHELLRLGPKAPRSLYTERDETCPPRKIPIRTRIVLPPSPYAVHFINLKMYGESYEEFSVTWFSSQTCRDCTPQRCRGPKVPVAKNWQALHELIFKLTDRALWH
jgi:hypothetical protein